MLHLQEVLCYVLATALFGDFRVRSILIAILLFSWASVQAATVTIDFEDAASVSPTTVDFGNGSYSAQTVSDHPSGFSFYGLPTNFLFCPNDCPPLAEGNGRSLYMASAGGTRVGAHMVRDDNTLFDVVELDVFLIDPAADGGCCGGAAGLNAVFSAWDENNSLLAQKTIYTSDGIGWQTIQFDSSFQGIHRLTYESQEQTWETTYGFVDNITVNVVPIPAAAWLFGSALAGLGWLRRKQSV